MTRVSDLGQVDKQLSVFFCFVFKSGNRAVSHNHFQSAGDRQGRPDGQVTKLLHWLHQDRKEHCWGSSEGRGHLLLEEDKMDSPCQNASWSPLAVQKPSHPLSCAVPASNRELDLGAKHYPGAHSASCLSICPALCVLCFFFLCSSELLCCPED